MVAAIVIGMGGGTKVLSAKLRLQEYIKNGEDNARIAIRLIKNEQQELICFERSFTTNGKSSYKVNFVTKFLFSHFLSTLFITNAFV